MFVFAEEVIYAVGIVCPPHSLTRNASLLSVLIHCLPSGSVAIAIAVMLLR